MMYAFRGLGLAASLVLISSLTVVPQARAQSTAAYVYIQIQGPAGAVYGYSASSSGQLTAISGSPFKPGTQIIGSNKAQFFTLGHTLLHSFAVGSNGAIQSQLSQIAFMNYSGGTCDGTLAGDAGAVLDHTGKYVYVVLQSAGGPCAAYQSYIVNKDGSFSFDGDTELNWNGNGSGAGLPSILGNETFAYSSYDYLDSGPVLTGFQRESSGTLQLMQFQENYPSLNGDYYVTGRPDASPAGNYLVVQLAPEGGGGSTQLGSYTVDSQGNISTTNTSSNMPATSFINLYTSFSPSGNLLAAYADGAETNGQSGIEIYNFNGAAPLTLYKTLLTGTPIDQVAWDSSNHLYAISTAQNKLYVFTVTATSVIQDSSISIGSPFSMVVVSQTATTGACPAPSSDGVNVCSPAEGATVTSPVLMDAAATVSGGVYRFELWSGSTKLLSVDNSGIMDQSVSLAAGSYKLTFVARNSSGTHEYAYRDITVE
ncbi:MAG TPA: hypothetical protein VG225_01105 [Terracidiphilus sp.]|jgi:hypothetical protein|nr:hypothetical protein [Terracidiphilus sp.]